MIDAQIIEAPRQRNNREVNKEVKEGKVPAKWKKNPHKLAQKDTDARWLKKNGVTFFGYKNHAVADVKHKLRRNFTVTDAATHDSVPAPDLLRSLPKGEDSYADSAYIGREIDKAIAERKLKSRIRVRIEHVFGRCSHMGADYIRCVGMARAQKK